MNGDEALKQLGLTRGEFHDLMTVFYAFYHGLKTDSQRAVVKRSLLTLDQAIKTFHDVDPKDLQKLFEDECRDEKAVAVNGYFASSTIS
jgi:hypothetical protein